MSSVKNIYKINGVSSLHIAVTKNDMNKLKVNLGSTPLNVFDDNDETALMIAIENGNLEMANLIIDAGANITAEKDDGDTAFTYAVYTDDTNINFIQSLIDKIAVLHIPSHDHWDSLYKDFKINMKMIQDITSSEVMIDYQFDEEYIKKMEEIKVINIEILKRLIELNEIMTVEHKSKYIENYIHPIFLAIGQKKLEMIKLLIESGTDINIHNKDDSSLLHLVDDDIEITKFLIKSGIDLNYQEKEQGNTPLHYTSDSNVRKILIEAGADINIKNKLNQSIRL